MNQGCPNSECLQSKIIKDGFFFRPSDGRKIQRYKCSNCGKRFSKATFDPCYRQNKRRVNFKLENLLSSGVSLRRATRMLHVNKNTIARKLQFLGKTSRKSHKRFLENHPKFRSIQFDDLHTIEISKCLPVAVTVVVDAETQKIIDFELSRMPANGHLAAISRKKYGLRPDERQQAIAKLFERIAPYIDPEATIVSDKHPYYAPLVKKYFPKAKYTQVKGRKSCIAGQGELKKGGYDPLFSLNHTCAMLRANINRLFRRTWCTTKSLDRLRDHLSIYVNYHNRVLKS